MDFLYSVFDFLDKVLYFISGLEINNKIDTSLLQEMYNDRLVGPDIYPAPN